MENEKVVCVTVISKSMVDNKCRFIKPAFLQNERHLIMQVVCEATQSTDTQVRVASLQCLVKIMSLYYHYMETYMGPALFAVSFVAVCHILMML